VATVRRIIQLTEQIESLKHQVHLLELERERLIEKASSEAGGAHFSDYPTSFPVHIGTDLSINEVLDIIVQAGEVDASHLAELTSLSYDGARLRLARYAKRGLLMRVSKGKYRVTAARQLHLATNGISHFDHEADEKSEPPSGANR
jgi:hypothetical protein